MKFLGWGCCPPRQAPEAVAAPPGMVPQSVREDKIREASDRNLGVFGQGYVRFRAVGVFRVARALGLCIGFFKFSLGLQAFNGFYIGI